MLKTWRALQKSAGFVREALNWWRQLKTLKHRKTVAWCGWTLLPAQEMFELLPPVKNVNWDSASEFLSSTGIEPPFEVTLPWRRMQWFNRMQWFYQIPTVIIVYLPRINVYSSYERQFIRHWLPFVAAICRSCRVLTIRLSFPHAPCRSINSRCFLWLRQTFVYQPFANPNVAATNLSTIAFFSSTQYITQPSMVHPTSSRRTTFSRGHPS